MRPYSRTGKWPYLNCPLCDLEHRSTKKARRHLRVYNNLKKMRAKRKRNEVS